MVFLDFALPANNSRLSLSVLQENLSVFVSNDVSGIPSRLILDVYLFVTFDSFFGLPPVFN